MRSLVAAIFPLVIMLNVGQTSILRPGGSPLALPMLPNTALRYRTVVLVQEYRGLGASSLISR